MTSAGCSRFGPSVSNGNPTAISANSLWPSGQDGWTPAAELKDWAELDGKGEYLYLDFGTAMSTTTNLLNSTPLAVSLRSRVVDQVARAGVNYKFDFDYATLVNLPR